ncbi:hypothetical protein [Actinoplanes sp. NPDC049802]|uniref:hypothetical protein n=1 Tax=Actinoplanes sp. NPDC049802 TaxID=3154742 RepID=UPI0033C07A8B
MYSQPWPGYSWPDPAPQQTAIAVTMRYFPLAFLMQLFRPVLLIDGYPVEAGWRHPVVVPVTPGQHHVHVHVPYLLPRRIGKADLIVLAQPGETVDLEYRAPVVVFADGALGSPPQRYRGMGAMVALLALTLVGVICSVGSVVVSAGDPAAFPRSAKPAPTGSDGTEPTVPALPPLPTDGPGLPTPGGVPPGGSAGEPTLRAGAPARKVTGATFAAGDETYTMSFRGWPFAFRTPSSWGCLGAKVDLAGAKAYVCVDEGNPGSGKRVVVMVRPCAAPCGQARMAQLDEELFTAATEPRRVDATTRFGQIKENSEGRYVLVLSHFFADGGGTGTPRWQVGVAGTAPPKARADVQKVVNEILSQTS